MEDVNTNETELDETLDVGGDVETEEDTDPAEDGEDDGLEYDDDGGLIIPDDEEAEEAGDTTPQAEESDPAPDAKDERIRELEAKLAEAVSKHTATSTAAARALAKLGIDVADPIAGLEHMAAEAEGKTDEEYRAELKREQEAAADAALLQEVKYARIREADFAAIVAEIPEAAQYKRVEDFPHFARFAALRRGGATPVEAFRATHTVETPKPTPDSKAHLRSNAVGGAKSSATTLTRSQMAEYREMFPGMSDRDIVALHKRASIKK